MAGFHQITVSGVEKTIRDAVVVTLAPPDGIDFSFIPGQYLTFRKELEGVELRRTYSICTGLDDGLIQVGIKRVDGGAFSTWANEALKPGETLDVMPPMGSFHVPPDPTGARHYLGFAGGSGITPILSILRTVLVREPECRFTLVYANRGMNTIMFREEIEDLKNRHLGRLSVVHILEQDAQEIDLFTGRIDAEKLNRLFAGWINLESVDFALICGPEPMMLTVRDGLERHGVAKDRIKIELFKSAQTGRLPLRPRATNGAAAKAVEARVTLDGTTRGFRMGRDLPLLQAAIDNDIDAPFACRAGVCSTCRCKLIEGEVEMAANHALEDYEVRRGYILSCQSYPVTDRIVIDYDQ